MNQNQSDPGHEAALMMAIVTSYGNPQHSGTGLIQVQRYSMLLSITSLS